MGQARLLTPEAARQPSATGTAWHPVRLGWHVMLPADAILTPCAHLLGPSGTLLLFGGTYGNLDNSRSKQQDNDNREVVAGTFAGVNNAKSDLWLFQDKKWTALSTPGTIPAARSFFGFSALPDSDTTFLLFGGFTVKRLPELADTWRLSLTSTSNTYAGAWQQIQPTGPSPSGRVGHGLTASNDGKMHLFGGGKFQWDQIDSKAQTLLLRTARPNTDAHWVFDPAGEIETFIASAYGMG